MARASVFIRVDRVFKYESFPSSGSGFFIHPNGYILTNWHVVADQIEGHLWQREREISAKVIGLTAVIDSGQPGERELAARIVARDRERDLALLRVAYRPRDWLGLDAIEDVRLGEQIWSAGFPYGDLLAMEKQVNQQDVPNPEVSLTSGMVTSLRRNAAGVLTMIQTDAALNPGSSGSAILNARGNLVGVVVAGIQGGEGLGFGIAPNRIRDFLEEQAVQIDIRPGVVLSPPQPIRVSVRPVLVDLDAASGSVRFDGSDIEPAEVALAAGEGRLEATVEFPDRISGRSRPARYELTVSLSARISGERMVRRFQLDAVPESFEKLHSARDPGEMMEDRKVLAHEMSIEDYNRSKRVAGGGSNRTLADVARSKKLKTDESGRVIVDNRTVDDLGGVSYDESRYRSIRDASLRALLQRYDRLKDEIDELTERIRAIRTDSHNYQYRSTLVQQSGALGREKSEIARSLGRHKVRWCEEPAVYFVADGDTESYPCRYPQSVY